MTDIAPEPPFVFADRYDVSTELGRGGFAIVYQAHDRVLGRDVAIKILRDELLPPSALKRFSLELRVTARLAHPNILHVYDSGTWEGRMYYVMEFVRGLTLEARLATEGALPVDDALRIARDVGQALAFAHDSGVIHRDVKPANILLRSGGALLGDFGIAQALSDNLAGPITSTGLAVGTLQYMSPEQLCAERKIDARTDQYSLALVCYEMLTGVGPHIASSVEGLRALRLAGSLTPVSTHRSAVSAFVNDAISRALSPQPADRFRDTRAFLSALAGIGTDERSAASGSRLGSVSGTTATPIVASEPARRRSPRARPVLLAAIAVALVVLGFAADRWRKSGGAPVSSADAAPSLAFVSATSIEDSVFVARLRAELDEWRDVNTARQVEPKPATLRQESPGAFRDLALQVGVSIVVRANVSTVGDSSRWSLSVYDVRSPLRIARVARLVSRGTDLDAGAVRGMIAHVLVGPSADSAPGLDGLRTPVLAAAKSYAAGWRWMRAGAIDSARVAFVSAAEQAPGFAQAELWAAQMGAWLSPTASTSWRDAAQQASKGGLRGTDSLLASALLALAVDDPPRACANYRTAIARAPDSFAAWFGLGQCQHVDSVVVSDPRIPGGFRFRSSHWSAIAAYEKALQRLPAGGMSTLFVDVVPITYASGNRVRSGVALPPDTSRYYALPSLDGDSVANLPVPRAKFVGTNATPESFSRAVERGRTRLLDLTREWITRAPLSADAWFYRAYTLELTGRLDGPDDANSAARALRRADSLNADPDRRVRLDVARVRVAARRGSFDEAIGLAKAALTRGAPQTSRIAALRAPLAAFVGDVDATVSLLRFAATTTDEKDRTRLPIWAANSLTPWLADSLRAFGVRAMLGVCDGLASRRDALDRDFRAHVAAAELTDQRVALLKPVFLAAVPCLGPSVSRGFKPGNPLEDAVAALDAGDAPGARAILERLNQSRRGMSVSTVTEDVLLTESWIWMHAGDTARARAILRSNMSDLVRMSPFTFDEVAQASALARIHKMMHQ